MKFVHTIKPVVLSSDPSTTASGEFYYNSASNTWRGWTGASWVDINSPSATISSSAVISASAVESDKLDGYHASLTSASNTVAVRNNLANIAAAGIEFDTTAAQTSSAGRLTWNNTDGTLDLGLKGGNVTLQIGQEQVVRVVNKTDTDLLESEYRAVRISSAQGQRLAVSLAKADNDANSTDTIGLVTETILKNQEGFITNSGLVRNINTTGDLQNETWSDGDILYLSGASAGYITNIKPVAPTHTVIIGFVVYAQQNNGKIFVKVDNGYEIDELHNVRISSASNNNILSYSSASSIWTNSTIQSKITNASVGYAEVSASSTNSTSATISASSVISSTSTSATISSSALIASSVDWSNVTNKPTSIASATISSSAIVSNSATTAGHANTASAVDWSGVTNKPTSIASATISSSAVIAASAAAFTGTITVNSTSSATISSSANVLTSPVSQASSATISSSAIISQTSLHANTASAIDWSGITSKPTSIASATISSSAIISSSVSWNGVSDKPTSIASATISSSAIVSASVDWAGVSNKPSSIASATLSSSAIISSSADWNGISNKPTSIASATISTSAIFSTSAVISGSVDWSGVSNKPETIASATISASSVISQSSVLAQHANTASSIAGSLVTGYVASASVATHAGTASSIAGSLVTGTVASATISSSATFATTASNVLVSPSAIYADRIDFVTSPVSAASVGRMTWNATSGTVELGMDNGVDLITALIGQSLYVKATNKDSVAMTRGAVVYISGAIGQRVAIKLASASANGIDKSPIGMCAEDIAINDSGFVIVRGTLSGVNTQAFTEGDAVWLSASAGKITNVRPPAPYGANVIGHVINSNIANGSINVTVIEGAKLSFLNDVVLTASTFTNNDVLAYNLSASYWENTSIQNKILTASVGYANVSASSTLSSSATIANNSASLGGYQASDYARLAAANTWSAVNTFQAGIYVGNGSNSQSLTTQTPVQSIPDGNDAAVVFRRSSSVTTNPVSALHKYDANLTASVSQRMLNFYLNGSLNGFITTNSIAAPAFGGTSDYRLKENIEDFTNSVNLIKEIKVRSFNWKDSGINSIGFIAHELKEVLPIAVDGEKDAVDDEGNPAYQSIMESRLIPYLTGALRDTILKVEKLEESIVQLQNRINELERQ